MESNSLTIDNPDESFLKLHIGTANFGTPYGVYGKSNLFEQSDIKNILHEASINKNIFVDTAESYFNSEIIIGENAPFKLNNKITTKIIIEKNDKFDSITRRVKKSLTRVKQECFYNVLIHNAESLYKENAFEIVKGLESCITEGLTQQIGVSCYEIGEIEYIKSNFNNIKNFQIPENVLDKRNFENIDLQRLYLNGNSITIRSIFLQGTLLSDLDLLPIFLHPEISKYASVENFCLNNNVSKLKYCLDYARSVKWKSGIVLGIQSYRQYEEIIKEISLPIKITNFPNEVLDEYFIDPRNWAL